MLSQDRRYAYAPRLLGLYGVLDRGDMTRTRAHRLPKETVLFIEDQDEYEMPDLLDAGFFLVSEEAAHVFSFYDENIPFSDIILLNKAKRTEFRCRLPVFEDMSIVCIRPVSAASPDSSKRRCSTGTGYGDGGYFKSTSVKCGKNRSS
jgi:hypothetical protein